MAKEESVIPAFGGSIRVALNLESAAAEVEVTTDQPPPVEVDLDAREVGQVTQSLSDAVGFLESSNKKRRVDPVIKESAGRKITVEAVRDGSLREGLISLTVGAGQWARTVTLTSKGARDLAAAFVPAVPRSPG